MVTLESSREASTIEVRLSDGTVRTATVVGLDAAADLAVLKINPSGLDLHPSPGATPPSWSPARQWLPSARRIVVANQ